MCGRATAGDFNLKLDDLKAAKKAEIEKLLATQAKTAKTDSTSPQPAPQPVEIGAADLAELEKQAATAMKDLAGERTRAVKRFLIKQHNLPAARITECRAVFDAKDTGMPRVDVSL